MPIQELGLMRPVAFRSSGLGESLRKLLEDSRYLAFEVGGASAGYTAGHLGIALAQGTTSVEEFAAKVLLSANMGLVAGLGLRLTRHLLPPTTEQFAARAQTEFARANMVHSYWGSDREYFEGSRSIPSAVDLASAVQQGYGHKEDLEKMASLGSVPFDQLDWNLKETVLRVAKQAFGGFDGFGERDSTLTFMKNLARAAQYGLPSLEARSV